LNGDGVDIVTQELETTGYRVLHAPDGLAALELHATHQPDLVILDWMLPKLDGLAVLTRLRSSSAVPVLMLTARGEEFDQTFQYARVDRAFRFIEYRHRELKKSSTQ
jgi:DNA-binding response OmpR family regulator